VATVRIGLDLKHEGRRFDMDAGDLLALARRGEAAGFESIWTNEDIGFDSFSALSAIAQHTTRVRLGTAIVNVYSRSAMQLAMAAATLDALSAGRAIVGISVGHHPWNDLGHGIPIEKPLARLREYVAFLRKALSGDAFTHDGTVFHGVNTRLAFDPVRRSIPLFIAGERLRIISLAGEVADGLMINVVSPEYVRDTAIPTFRAAAEEAGRDASDLQVTALVTCSYSEDGDQALSWARAMVAHRLRQSLKMLDTQPPERHDEIRRVHALMVAGKPAAAEAEVSEELARSIVVAGGVRDLKAGIERYIEAGCTRLILVAYPRGRDAVERFCSVAPELIGASPT
jgi:alkanesulfonate monooxygenase SsuD/methylene tetrahydromethanopterin reductase-like flavin-dependent oxidoreductase (luciferase family)